MFLEYKEASPGKATFKLRPQGQERGAMSSQEHRMVQGTGAEGRGSGRLNSDNNKKSDREEDQDGLNTRAGIKSGRALRPS